MNIPSDPEIDPEFLPSENVVDDNDLSRLPDEEYEDEEEEAIEEEPDNELRLHVPHLLVWVGLAVVGLLCGIVFFLNLSQSSWDMGGNSQRVNLGICVLPWRDKLLAADAPSPVVERLTMAAQPGIWKTEAYTHLREAQQLLLPLADKPEIAVVFNELTAMLPDNAWGYLGCDYQRVRTEPLFPTLHPVP